MKNIYKMGITELENAMLEESKKYGKDYDGGLSEIRWIRFFRLQHKKGIEYSEMLKDYSKKDDMNEYSNIALKVLNKLIKGGKNKMNEIIFKSKRQEKDFEKIYFNIGFKDSDVKQFEDGHIIVSLKYFNNNLLNEVDDFIKKLENKNIRYNSSHKAISIT